MERESAMIGICPSCENESSLVLVRRPEELIIRGEIITVDVEYYKCEECGEEFEDPKSEYDPVEIAYTKYRELMGMVKPEEIRDFRKEIGLTQYELSKLIGIGIATLNRYENGALQSAAHDRILRLYMEHRNLRRLIEEDSDVLDDEKRKNILQILTQESKSHYLSNLIEEILEHRKQSVFNGYKKFDLDKFRNTIKYFSYPEKVFKTKLTKLLFYADFVHYRQYSISITGSCYAHLPYGPVPDNYETLLGLILDKDKSIRIEEIWQYDFPGETYISNSPPDFTIFTDSEIKTLATIKEKFNDFNVRRIRDFSHNEKGYQATNDGELISFSYAEELQDI